MSNRNFLPGTDTPKKINFHDIISEEEEADDDDDES